MAETSLGAVRPNAQDNTVSEGGESESDSSKAAAMSLVEPLYEKGKEHGIHYDDNLAQHQQGIEEPTNLSAIYGPGDNYSLSQPLSAKVGDESTPGLNDSERTGSRYAKAAERL